MDKSFGDYLAGAGYFLLDTTREAVLRHGNIYGTRKIKKELQKLNFQISRRCIGRIMRKLGLISKYTVAQFKVHKQKCNEDPVKNELNREFNGQKPYAVVYPTVNSL